MGTRIGLHLCHSENLWIGAHSHTPLYLTTDDADNEPLWQTGYVMPQHYRGNGYKVDYQEHNLPRPERKQQWYKINQDYILVDVENHHILRIAGL